MRRLLTTSLLLALLLTGVLAPAAAQDNGRWVTHVVQAEENLFRIALQYNLSVDAVMAANGLSDPDLVMVGQQLLIPLSGDSAPTTPAAPVRTTVLGSTVMHTVAAGDTLTQIAAQYGVTLSALLSENNLTSDVPIRTGQVLVIPVQSEDLGLIGVGPITIPVSSRAAGDNALAQQDLGIIGASEAPARAASAPETTHQPAAAESPGAAPETASESAATTPDKASEAGTDASAIDPACIGCDTERETFKAAMDAAIEAIGSADVIDLAPADAATDTTADQAPDDVPGTTNDASSAATDASAPEAPDAEAIPQQQPSANDLGILPVGEDTAMNARTSSDAGEAVEASDSATDLGIIAPETAQLRDAGVITLNSDRLRRIYLYGLSQGNNPHAFSTIGDCNSEPPFFLAKFDRGEYNLGPHTSLQPVIDHFAGSFDRKSAAVWTGNHVWALFDATWSNPALCQPGEIPLACEFRIQKPSIALIRLGTNEVGNAQLFEENMRRVISFALENGTIPVLGTKADRLEGSDAMNNIIRELANEYAIPLWDFSKAADQVPARGLMPDGFHMTYFPPDYSTPLALQSGHGMQNLTALMALDAVWREVAR